MHDLAVARPELLGVGFLGQHMRREHDGRRRDHVDTVKTRRSALRRRLQSRAPAQIFARRESLGILERRRIDRIDRLEPIRQFAVEESAQLDRGHAALGKNRVSLARFRERCFLQHGAGTGELVDRRADNFIDAVFAIVPEPGVGNADANAADTRRHPAHKRKAVAQIWIERGEGKGRVDHAARQDSRRVEGETQRHDAFGRPAILGDFQPGIAGHRRWQAHRGRGIAAESQQS